MSLSITKFFDLRNEMNLSDYRVGERKEETWGFDHFCLHATFSDVSLSLNNSGEEMRSLQKFLNNKIRGPYFIAQTDPRYQEKYASIVILKDEDVQRFEEEYPNWKFNVDSKDKNARTLMEWDRRGRQVSDPSINRYVFGQ